MANERKVPKLYENLISLNERLTPSDISLLENGFRGARRVSFASPLVQVDNRNGRDSDSGGDSNAEEYYRNRPNEEDNDNHDNAGNENDEEEQVQEEGEEEVRHHNQQQHPPLPRPPVRNPPNHIERPVPAPPQPEDHDEDEHPPVRRASDEDLHRPVQPQHRPLPRPPVENPPDHIEPPLRAPPQPENQAEDEHALVRRAPGDDLQRPAQPQLQPQLPRIAQPNPANQPSPWDFITHTIAVLLPKLFVFGVLVLLFKVSGLIAPIVAILRLMTGLFNSLAMQMETNQQTPTRSCDVPPPSLPGALQGALATDMYESIRSRDHQRVSAYVVSSHDGFASHPNQWYALMQGLSDVGQAVAEQLDGHWTFARVREHEQYRSSRRLPLFPHHHEVDEPALEIDTRLQDMTSNLSMSARQFNRNITDIAADLRLARTQLIPILLQYECDAGCLWATGNKYSALHCLIQNSIFKRVDRAIPALWWLWANNIQQHYEVENSIWRHPWFQVQMYTRKLHRVLSQYEDLIQETADSVTALRNGPVTKLADILAKGHKNMEEYCRVTDRRGEDSRRKDKTAKPLTDSDFQSVSVVIASHSKSYSTLSSISSPGSSSSSPSDVSKYGSDTDDLRAALCIPLFLQQFYQPCQSQEESEEQTLDRKLMCQRLEKVKHSWDTIMAATAMGTRMAASIRDQIFSSTSTSHLEADDMFFQSILEFGTSCLQNAERGEKANADRAKTQRIAKPAQLLRLLLRDLSEIDRFAASYANRGVVPSLVFSGNTHVIAFLEVLSIMADAADILVKGDVMSGGLID